MQFGYKTRDLSEASSRKSPDDSADVAGDMEDEGDSEDPQEVDEDVMTFLSTLHQDATLTVQQGYFTDLNIILRVHGNDNIGNNKEESKSNFKKILQHEKEEVCRRSIKSSTNFLSLSLS